MPRPRGPLPPRISPPDLPRTLESVSGVGRRADLEGARIRDLTDEVDAAHARLTECTVDGASVSRLDLTGATLTDVDVIDLRATEFIARNGRWRTVRVTGGRIGTLDLSSAELTGVALRGVRIDYLSLRGANASDVIVADCSIGTVDLPLATLSRVAFVDSRADEVATDGLRAEHVDLRGLDALALTSPESLRGATLSERQVESLAVPLARALGIDVQD
ncbi:pentapeptide repeat-containing protein [Microbacterium sp. SS28]|uniref:pentapeptide repeat-containing protein n=1 Tax=Microbacterium sp. SS28 TaxID=2919948 RepID=UPI001FAAFCEC|nr:pentapeptide repeat-containing protein [Microbacterium sp. SS28]